MQDRRNLDAYSADYLPCVFALHNHGAVCYLNSMIQALASCTSLNKYLIEGIGESRPDTISLSSMSLTRQYVKLINDNLEEIPKINTENMSGLANFLARVKANALSGQQEDAQEGFVIFLEYLNPSPEKLFHVRYTCEIRCKVCKFIRKVEHSEEPEIMIDITEKDPLLQRKLDSMEEVVKYISTNMQIPADYKCDKCGAINSVNEETGIVTPNIYQIYQLSRVSEVIVLFSKKYIWGEYSQKENQYFPPTLDIKAKGGRILHYRMVAQIDQRGNNNSGHYVCRCFRKKPLAMHSRRRKKIEKTIAEREGQIASGKFPEHYVAELRNKIKELKKNIEHDLKMESEKYGVFLCNDDKIKFCPEGFNINEDTYMIFYHLT